MLFCDLRGFPRKVEQACDELPLLLEQVSEALSVMTRCILKFEGVIADFQGDAALGFWGWPTQLDDSAAHACRAALAIHEAFCLANEDPQLSLTGEQLRCHEAAVEAFSKNSWEEAKQLLQQLPITDGPANFLRGVMAHLDEAPSGWDEAINLEDKSGQRMLALQSTRELKLNE